jgi:hypothetical protein
MTVAAAFPFIEVSVDTSALQPIAQSSPGVLAVVGATAAGAAGGAAAPNTPTLVSTVEDADTLFSSVTNGVAAANPLHDALVLALLQNPRPSTLYGVRVDGDNVAAALASLEAADDVTFVALAATTDVGGAANGANPPTGLTALKQHVEDVSADGNLRVGVAMVDPGHAKSPTYAADILAAAAPLRSSSSRMIVVAARGSGDDVAVAAAAAIAGLPPGTSIVLKQVSGVSIPLTEQYGPSEIRDLSEGGIVPVIDPALIVGSSLHFADGRCFTSDDSILFVDIRRLLDDLVRLLRAGLITLIGDARITKSGLTLVRARIEGILGPLQRSGALDSFDVQIPLLDILSRPEASWSATDQAMVTDARTNRTASAHLTVELGPGASKFAIVLSPTFA